MLDPSVHLGTIPTEDRPGWCLFMEHDPGIKGTWTPGLGEMAKGHTFCLEGSRLCVGHKVKVKAAQLCPTLCDPMDCIVHGILQARMTGVGSRSLLQAIFPTQGLNPGSPTSQVDSLPAEPPRKPKNTGLGNPSILQRIFLAQELNWSLPHCRRILLPTEL